MAHRKSVDVMGEYPRASLTQAKYIVEVQDLFSKFVEAIPVKSSTASRIIRVLDDLFCRFGFPSNIITDSAKIYQSEEWTTACKRWGANSELTPIFCQRANAVERAIQNLKKQLKIALLDN